MSSKLIQPKLNIGAAGEEFTLGSNHDHLFSSFDI